MLGVSSFCLHEEPLADALEKLSAITGLVEIMDDGRHFVNTSDELAQFSEVVSLESAHSIYCIVGMGGIGKTALAIHVAHKLRYHFTGGVLWADAATSDPLAILDNWAGAYGSDSFH